MNIVSLPKDDRIVNFVTDLLEACKSGKIITLTVIEEYSDGKYAITGTKTFSRTHTAGMLLDAAITRLQHE